MGCTRASNHQLLLPTAAAAACSERASFALREAASALAALSALSLASICRTIISFRGGDGPSVAVSACASSMRPLASFSSLAQLCFGRQRETRR
jgi:hypothetical protein